MFTQIGLHFIKKTTVEGWFSRAVDALIPLYDLQVAHVMSQDYLQADESSIKVLQKNRQGSAHRGQMWVCYSPCDNSVLYHYDPSRSTAAGRRLLSQHKGTHLQSDGYAVYENIAKENQSRLIFCHAHARRKFKEAFDKKEHPKLCAYVLKVYQELYAIERSAREEQLDYNQRKELRKKESIPKLLLLKTWLDRHLLKREILPKSRLGIAIRYSVKRWEGLIAYCEDGRLEIDNNLVENTIRPLALGRKNYLFAGSDDGAHRLAICYSLVNSCLKNKINPSKYLNWVLKKIASNKVDNKAINWLPQNLNEKIVDSLII